MSKAAEPAPSLRVCFCSAGKSATRQECGLRVVGSRYLRRGASAFVRDSRLAYKGPRAEARSAVCDRLMSAREPTLANFIWPAQIGRTRSHDELS
jgi:hypothetical protein